MVPAGAVKGHFALAFLLLLHCGRSADAPSVAAADAYAAPRESMVREQIAARGVADQDVLAALRSVPRHLFVPENMAAEAYSDSPLPIGFSQTISQPYIVAYMSELLDLEKGHKVLEIGTGSGYQAAVLSLLAGEVYTIEIVDELGRQAVARLDGLGYKNVKVRVGNGYLGWPEEAPFDRILLTAAPEEIPQPLIEQLRPGGRLVAPVGPVFGVQELVVVDKDSSGKVSRRSELPVRFVPMVEKPRQQN
jgi:protein-L-isoaspartate(D-aspartate) O-methyltransferase